MTIRHRFGRQVALRAVAVMVLLLGLLPLAQAEDLKTADDMHDAVATAVGSARALADIGDYGFKPRTCILGALLDPLQEVSFTEELEPGANYLIIGGGDKDVNDITLWATAGNQVLAKDKEQDNSPNIHFQCGNQAKVTIHIKLAAAERSSFCAIAILADTGYDVPLENLEAAVANAVEFANSVAEEAGGASFLRGKGNFALIGAVLDVRERLTVGGVRLGAGAHVALAACDGQSEDLTLDMLDPQGEVIATDEEEDNLPVVMYESQAGDHSVRIGNAAGAASLVVSCLLEPAE